MDTWNQPDGNSPGAAAVPASTEPPPFTFGPFAAQALPIGRPAAAPCARSLVRDSAAAADRTTAADGCGAGPGTSGATPRARYGPGSNACTAPGGWTGSHRIVRPIPSAPASTA